MPTRRRARARVDAQQRRFASALGTADPERDRPLAIPARHERPRGRPARPGASAPRRGSPGCERRLRSARRYRRARRAGLRHDRRARPGGSGTPPATGAGIKIGIIDDGVDQTHAFFDPTGYTMPPGFPKGQLVVHDREGDRRARLPAAGGDLARSPAGRSTPSSRGTRTHVAGIAAGNANTQAEGARISRRRAARLHRELQGADRPDGRERRSRRERAGDRRRDRGGGRRRDGRDQPLARRARDRAAARRRRARARRRRGRRRRARRRRRERLRASSAPGSVTSPGSAAKAITVAASTIAPVPVDRRRSPPPARPRSRFGSSPTSPRRESASSRPLPGRLGAPSPARAWRRRTSPGPPRCCSSATRLDARPGEGGADGRPPARRPATVSAVDPTRRAPGLIDVAAADHPLVRPTPTVALVRPPRRRARPSSVDVRLDDAGGGVEPWTVTVDLRRRTGRRTTRRCRTGRSRPGDAGRSDRRVRLRADGELAGAIVLTRGTA